ncbi:UNVERIFIED_ORG: hypothetical protein J2S29_001256 [Rhizobium sp. SLBN-170]
MIGVGIVLYQMRKDGRNSSAAVVLSICTNVRNELRGIGSKSHQAAAGEISEFEAAFRDLLNELELASAIILDGAASGRTGNVARLLLIDVLKAVQRDPPLVEMVKRAVHDRTTFGNMRLFIRKNRKQLAVLTELV